MSVTGVVLFSLFRFSLKSSYPGGNSQCLPIVHSVRCAHALREL